MVVSVSLRMGFIVLVFFIFGLFVVLFVVVLFFGFVLLFVVCVFSVKLISIGLWLEDWYVFGV